MIILAFLLLVMYPCLCGALTKPNCLYESALCGATLCCPLDGHFCNFNRGIPYCGKNREVIASVSMGQPCTDPYLFDCSWSTGMSGCCPIGTLCFHGDLHNSRLSCIDAYGDWSPSYPMNTVGFVPPEANATSSEPAVLYSPSTSWNTSTTVPNCTSSTSIRVTSKINATISFNYTGLSVRVHTVTSPNGGVFTVFVDGHNTTSTIDTYSNPDSPLPLCYPQQYPPFFYPPPDFAMRDNHTITLVYTGPSPNAPNSSYSHEGLFDSFAIPQFQIPYTGNDNRILMEECRSVIFTLKEAIRVILLAIQASKLVPSLFAVILFGTYAVKNRRAARFRNFVAQRFAALPRLTASKDH